MDLTVVAHASPHRYYRNNGALKWVHCSNPRRQRYWKVKGEEKESAEKKRERGNGSRESREWEENLVILFLWTKSHQQPLRAEWAPLRQNRANPTLKHTMRVGASSLFRHKCSLVALQLMMAPDFSATRGCFSFMVRHEEHGDVEQNAGVKQKSVDFWTSYQQEILQTKRPWRSRKPRHKDISPLLKGNKTRPDKQTNKDSKPTTARQNNNQPPQNKTQSCVLKVNRTPPEPKENKMRQN